MVAKSYSSWALSSAWLEHSPLILSWRERGVVGSNPIGPIKYKVIINAKDPYKSEEKLRAYYKQEA